MTAELGEKGLSRDQTAAGKVLCDLNVHSFGIFLSLLARNKPALLSTPQEYNF